MDKPATAPFMTGQYVVLPGDRVMYIGHDPRTGVMCPGRDLEFDACGDEMALNSAWYLGYAKAMEQVMLRMGYSPRLPVEREPTYAEWMRAEIARAIKAANIEVDVDDEPEGLLRGQLARDARKSRPGATGGGA